MLIRVLLAIVFIVFVHVLAYREYKNESEKLMPEQRRSIDLGY